MLIPPGSRIHRAACSKNTVDPRFGPFLTSDVFTLQWHITQHCALHCKHCYDRSDRTTMSEDKASKVLALLPDGDVHACRKFPSLLGNMLEMSLINIYHNESADRYRAGSCACHQCH